MSAEPMTRRRVCPGSPGSDTADTKDTSTDTDTSVRSEFRRLTEMKAEPTKWLAIGYLPAAAVAYLVGEEGLGKSLWWVWVCAHITTGKRCEAIGYAGGLPRDVVVIATEDGAGELVDRLRHAGADLHRVHLLSEDDKTAATFMGDAVNVESVVGAYIDTLGKGDESPALVVIDAWLDTVPGALSVQKPQEARRALAPWRALAAKRNVCVLVVGHTNRLDTGNIRDKYGATGVVRQAARQTIYAARSPLGTLTIGPDKSNHAATRNAVTFRLDVQQVRTPADDDPGTTARLVFEGETAAPIREHVATWHADAKRADPDKLSDTMQRVLAFVGDSAEPVNAAAVTKALKLPKGHASKYLSRLTDRNLLERAGRGSYRKKTPVSDTGEAS